MYILYLSFKLYHVFLSHIIQLHFIATLVNHSLLLFTFLELPREKPGKLVRKKSGSLTNRGKIIAFDWEKTNDFWFEFISRPEPGSKYREFETRDSDPFGQHQESRQECILLYV